MDHPNQVIHLDTHRKTFIVFLFIIFTALFFDVALVCVGLKFSSFGGCVMPTVSVASGCRTVF